MLFCIVLLVLLEQICKLIIIIEAAHIFIFVFIANTAHSKHYLIQKCYFYLIRFSNYIDLYLIIQRISRYNQRKYYKIFIENISKAHLLFTIFISCHRESYGFIIEQFAFLIIKIRAKLFVCYLFDRFLYNLIKYDLCANNFVELENSQSYHFFRNVPANRKIFVRNSARNSTTYRSKEFITSE